MRAKWPGKVFPATGGDWHVSITSQMAGDLFPDKHTLRAELMLLQLGYTNKGREFSIPQNSRNCWEVNSIHINRAKKKLVDAGFLAEIPPGNNGQKRKLHLTPKAMAYQLQAKRRSE
jgi:hypothetical protein